MRELSPNEQPLIAIIDDDPMIRILMAEVLIDAGFQPLLWDGIDNPSAFVARVKPAVVVLDLRMGYGATSAPTLEQLMVLQAAAGVPIILCSADITFLDGHAEALHAAGIHVLSKPFDRDAFVACVEQAARQRSDGASRARTQRSASLLRDVPLH